MSDNLRSLKRLVRPALAVSVCDALYHASGLEEVADCFSDRAILAIADEVRSLLEDVESMARQHCHTRHQAKDYNGLKAGTMITDSGGLSADAQALRSLAAHGRFRIVAENGRMVCGYWPENDPQPNA